MLNVYMQVQGGHRAVSLDVRAEGQQQVLRISNYVADRSLYKPKRRETGSLSRSNTLRPDSASSSQEAFEAVTEEVAPTMTIRLNLHGIGISLMNRQLVEVVYLTLSTLKVEYASSPVMQSITVACGSLQLDNQLHDAIFPVVLQPTPIGKEAGGVAALPTVQASLMWLTDQGTLISAPNRLCISLDYIAHGVFFIKYCSILLQALTIEADEDFLFAMYELAQFQGGSWNQSHPE
jgi:vacuolar protein sorting-associated protein 13A/C